MTYPVRGTPPVAWGSDHSIVTELFVIPMILTRPTASGIAATNNMTSQLANFENEKYIRKCSNEICTVPENYLI